MSFKKFLKLLPKIIFPLLIVLITGYLCFKNYTPGTYLIGWDSLHPEFNFPEAFRRVLEGVWRGDQGVGAIAAHSHMADWPRIVILWIESLIIPTSLLRYSYIFLCLILGPLGVYRLMKSIMLGVTRAGEPQGRGSELVSRWKGPGAGERQDPDVVAGPVGSSSRPTFLAAAAGARRDSLRFRHPLCVELAAFLAALFYLLNLGTLQQFFVPFEMFPTQFAFLPWLILFVIKIFRQGRKWDYIAFALLTILASPQAYAATLWYAYFGALSVFVFVYFILGPSKKIFKKGLSLIVLTLLLNLYWILPNIYSVIYQSATVINANINLLFTPEAYLRNLGYEGLRYVLIQKNFLFDWRAFNYSTNQFTDLMFTWNRWLSVGGVLPTLYVLAGISVFGAILSIIRKDRIGVSILAVALYSLFFLAGGKYINFQNLHFPGGSIFAEALRMPFTKFSIIFELTLSVFFGYFFFVITSFTKLKFLKAFLEILLLLAVPSALIFTTLPMFYGNLISPIVRRNLPGEYKKVFSWFNSNAQGRVTVLPEINLWGWDYHSWHYEGSGFISFGLSDPLLVRDFDRWSSNNEDFYTQSSFALYANNPQAFINTLKKYQVEYVLLDESLINAGGSDAISYIPQIKNILDTSPDISKKAQFGFMTIYKVNIPEGEVSAPASFNKYNADLTYSEIDPLYPQGTYIEDSSSTTYPFINFDGRGDVKISASDTGTSSAQVKFVNTATNSTAAFDIQNPIINDLRQGGGQKEAVNCDLYKVGSVGKELTGKGILYTADGGGVSCDNLDYPDLKYSQSFVIRVSGQNLKGRSLKIYLFNWYTGQPVLQELLPNGNFDNYYFVYSQNLQGGGYSLNLETRSFVGVPSENLLTKVEIYPVNYGLLSGLEEGPVGSELTANFIAVTGVRKYLGWIYKVDTKGSGLIQLGQGYDNGWVALQLPFNVFHLSFLKHVKVDSWANGWIVPQSQIPDSGSRVLIIYLPQFLEWEGALVGVFVFLALVFRRQKNS